MGALWELEESWLRITEASTAAGKEIEEDIIEELVRRHSVWMTMGEDENP